MTNANTGNLYNSDRDLTDTAKLVRKALKAKFPRCKFSVRISRYSMGQSLSVYLKAIKGTEDINLVCLLDDECGKRWIPRANVQAILDTVESMVQSYNRRDVDSQTDYYNVHFSLTVGLDWQVKSDAGDAAQARLDSIVADAKAATAEMVVADSTAVSEAANDDTDDETHEVVQDVAEKPEQLVACASTRPGISVLWAS